MNKTFAIIGSGGYIAKRHKEAINRIDGKIVIDYDPIYSNLQYPHHIFKSDFKYLVICSPSNTHYDYIKMGLENGKKIICEKPAFLPWQPIIDNNDINVVLQYRFLRLKDHIKNPTKVKVKMVRDKKYLKSSKMDSRLTGGIFFNLFVHYIDLALQYDCDFEGFVETTGKQYRLVEGGKSDYNLDSIPAEDLYERMYKKIVNDDKGVKPKDIMYLRWWLERHSEIFGYGKEIVNSAGVFIKSKF